MALTRTKFILPEDRIPRAWYNINADLPGAARRRRSIPAPSSPSVQTTSCPSSPWPSSPRR